jgi:hypothetical protein
VFLGHTSVTCGDARIPFPDLRFDAHPLLHPFPSFLDVSRSFAGRMRDESARHTLSMSVAIVAVVSAVAAT